MFGRELMDSAALGSGMNKNSLKSHLRIENNTLFSRNTPDFAIGGCTALRRPIQHTKHINKIL